jgi:uncharacterized delta-60 repeat protein
MTSRPCPRDTLPSFVSAGDHPGTGVKDQSELCQASSGVGTSSITRSTSGTESAGKVVTDFGGAEDVARAVGVQPDGRIVAVGWSHVDLALARYNTDGTLDPTFGTGGRVLTDFFDVGSDDRAYAMALQPDGKVVAAGSANGGSSVDSFGLARYRTARWIPGSPSGRSWPQGPPP